MKLARGMNPSLEAHAIISMAPINPVIDEAQEAMELLAELHELVLSKVIIRERKVYRDAIAEGRGVVELQNEKATAEIEALGQEIYEFEEKT